MKLNFREFPGPGEPLLVLHGLFGSLGNWNWHSKMFSRHFRVFALDLRNHGGSPHSETMNYQVMAEDVLEFLDSQGLDAVHLLGHSMGGKVAMQLALEHPERIKGLVIADIAPVQYSGEHDTIFKGLLSLDLDSVKSRTEADGALAKEVEDEVVRQFLLTNLQRDSDGGFSWRINLPVLAESYAALRAVPECKSPYEKAVLFLKGDLSNYITEKHREQILSFFPKAELKTIMQAGHWLHAEKPQTFYRLVAEFLGVDKSEINS